MLKRKKLSKKINHAKCARKGEFFLQCHCYNGERILEFLKKSSATVWDFTAKNGEIEFYCKGVSEFDLVVIIRKCGGEDVKLTDVSRRARLIKSIPIAVGIVVFCAALLFSTLFVFRIEVACEDEVLQLHIKNIADEIFPFGALKSDEKFKQLKSELNENQDVAIFTIEVYQNTIFINVLQAENAYIIPKTTSVVAPETGTLLYLSTLEGTAQKAAGDFVEKGEVLISAQTGGETPIETDSASGGGILQVEKEKTYSFSQISTVRTYSGEYEEVRYFIIGENEFFNPESKFESYITQNKSVEFISPNIAIISETRFEYHDQTVVFTPAEMEEMARSIFKQNCLQDFAHTIISLETAWQMADGVCKVSVICKYLLQF